MKTKKKSSNRLFFNQYRYRIDTQSYVVLKPETCCPHRTEKNEKGPLDNTRSAINSRDTKLRRDNSRWGAVSVYFNDITLVDDLHEMRDLVAFNLLERVIDNK